MKYKLCFTAIFALLLTCCTSNKTLLEESLNITEYAEESFTATINDIVPTDDNTAVLSSEFVASGWRRAYAEYIKKFSDCSYFSYSLIYLDDDDIPELFVSTGGEASGEIVLTYFNEQVYEQPISRLGTKYIERSGLLYCDNGHMGYYPVYIKKLESGVFSDIATGTRCCRLSEEGKILFDENDSLIMEYVWEDDVVSEDIFYTNIDTIFNREQGVYPNRRYSMVELLSVLNTGGSTSASHRYELIQDNVTWQEAQAFCKEKGGYLATITSPDEQDAVAAQIAKEEKMDVSFYVGYRSNEWVGENFLSSRWINADGSYTYANFLYDFGRYSAPDYDSKKSEWDSENKDCGLIKYYDSVSQIYLFDAPEDLLTVSPEYSGVMGYICEFDVLN